MCAQDTTSHRSHAYAARLHAHTAPPLLAHAYTPYITAATIDDPLSALRDCCVTVAVMVASVAYWGATCWLSYEGAVT